MKRKSLADNNLNLRIGDLQVFSSKFDNNDVPTVKALLKKQIQHVSELVHKRVTGKILFTQEKTSKSYFINFLHNELIQYIELAGLFHEIVISDQFIALLKNCAMLIGNSEHETEAGLVSKSEKIICSLADRFCEIPYDVTIREKPYLLTALIDLYMYLWMFDRAEILISEVIRSISVKNGVMNARDCIILGNMYLLWYSCDPKKYREERSANKLTESRRRFNDAKTIANQMKNKLGTDLANMANQQLQVISSMEKVRQTEDALLLVLKNVETRSQASVVTIVSSPSNAPTIISQLHHHISAYLKQKPQQAISDLFQNAPSSKKQNEVKQEKQEWIEPDKEEGFKGDYNEYIHEYEATQRKGRRELKRAAISDIAHKRMLKKIKTDHVKNEEEEF